MKSFGCVIVLLISSILHAQTSPDISKTVFSSPDVKKVQQAYNRAVQQALQQYRVQVAKAQESYCHLLNSAYKIQLAKEDLEEAIKIRNEISEYQLDLDEGLVLYYDFDNPTPGGRVCDKSPRGNHGRVKGATWVSGGRIGGAYSFDITRKKDVIVVPDTNSLDCERITVSAWIKTNDKDEHWNRILDKDYRHGYNLCMGGDFQNRKFRGKVFFELCEKAIGSDRSVADDQWHHVAATYDGKIMKLYIDGKLQNNTQKWSGQIPTNDYNIGIGNEHPGDDFDEFLAFDGLLDEIRVYNRGLSEKEVEALYSLQ